MRTVVPVETMASVANQGLTRVLSLVEKLHRDGAITYEQYAAAGILRNQLMMEMAPSEGVSSYGSNIKASEPSRKADRVGRRLTGFEVDPDGALRYAGGRRSRANERKLEDAIFAAVGLHNDEGARMVNVQHADILIRVVTHTESMPTLTGITLELTSYYGAKSKQTPPYALGAVQVWLGRLALHYRLSK
jgi:hypothetical protein